MKLVPGQLVSLALILANAALVLPALRRRPALAYQFVGSNLIFGGLLIIVFYVAAMINNNVLYPHPPVMYDPNYEGYHRSDFPGTAMLAVCVGWLLWLRRVGRLGSGLQLQTA